jgi:hypothetical protein
VLRLVQHFISFTGRRRREVLPLSFEWVCAVGPNRLQPRLEGVLEDLGIFSDQCVLLGKYFMRPGSGVIA